MENRSKVDGGAGWIILFTSLWVHCTHKDKLGVTKPQLRSKGTGE